MFVGILPADALMPDGTRPSADMMMTSYLTISTVIINALYICVCVCWHYFIVSIGYFMIFENYINCDHQLCAGKCSVAYWHQTIGSHSDDYTGSIMVIFPIRILLLEALCIVANHSIH